MNNLHLSGLTRNNWIISAILLVGVLIFMQLYLLSNMGTKGQELNDIRTQQSNLKIENEILKAKILELRSNKVVLEGLAGDDNLRQKDLKLIDPDTLSISAMN
jgi:cell division protein FtsL